MRGTTSNSPFRAGLIGSNLTLEKAVRPPAPQRAGLLSADLALEKARSLPQPQRGVYPK